MTFDRPPALILAGGKSSRMGSEKLLLPFGRDNLLAHILRRLSHQASSVAINAPAALAASGEIRIVPDTLAGQPGPLAGVLAGLRDLSSHRTEATHLLTVPSDAPFLPEDLAARLGSAVQGNEGVAVAGSAGRIHPVFALWPVSIADHLEAWLADPANRRMSVFLARHQSVTVDWTLVATPIGPLDPFMNVNTPADLDKARRFLEVLP